MPVRSLLRSVVNGSTAGWYVLGSSSKLHTREPSRGQASAGRDLPTTEAPAGRGAPPADDAGRADALLTPAVQEHVRRPPDDAKALVERRAAENVARSLLEPGRDVETLEVRVEPERLDAQVHRLVAACGE